MVEFNESMMIDRCKEICVSFDPSFIACRHVMYISVVYQTVTIGLNFFREWSVIQSFVSVSMLEMDALMMLLHPVVLIVYGLINADII